MKKLNTLQIIVAIIFIFLISHGNSVKFRACDKMERQTPIIPDNTNSTMPMFSDSAPSPKYFRNVGNFKCITGVDEGDDISLSFCQIGDRKQIWNFIGYKDKKNIFSLQNVKEAITVMDAPCGIKEESPIRLWITNYQDHQMFKFDLIDEKLGYYKISSFNMASLCLSSKSSAGEEGLFQVTCNDQDINQKWTFLDPIKPFDKNWVAFYPKVWGKDKILSIKKVDSKNANFEQRFKKSDQDKFLRGNSWIFTSVPDSHSFYISVEEGYAIYAHNDNFAYLYLTELKEWYQWDVMLVADYVISIRNVYYDKCLTFSDNNKVSLSDCDFRDEQRIYYDLADKLPNSNSFTIQETISTNIKKCVEVQKNDSPIKHRECTQNNGFQAWKTKLNTDGSFTFMSAYGGIFISQYLTNCSKECLYSSKYYDSSNPANRWYIIPVSEGKYVFSNQYQKQELFAKTSEEYNYSKNGTIFSFVAYIYGKPRKTPFYSISSTEKTVIRYTENSSYKVTSGTLMGKDVASAFKLLLNQDKTYNIEFINGWVLANSNSLGVHLTHPQDKNASIKWIILPFDDISVIIHFDTAKCLSVQPSNISLVDCTPSIIKNNRKLLINYIINSAPEIPTSLSSIVNLNYSVNKSYRLKLSPQNIFVDGTSEFQTSWKIEKIQGSLFSSIISNSGLPLVVGMQDKWIISPVGTREFVIKSQNGSYLFFNYGNISGGLKQTVVAQLNSSSKTQFVFVEETEGLKLDKGLYTISFDTRFLSLEDKFFMVNPQKNNPRIYMRIIENPQKKTFMITASNGIILDKPKSILTSSNSSKILANTSSDFSQYLPQAIADSSTEWFLIYESNQKYFISTKDGNNNVCLTIDSNNTSRIYLSECSNSNNLQKFTFKPAIISTFDTCNYFYLKTLDNLCLHSYSFQKYIKHVICQENDASLVFKFSSEGKATYKIRGLTGQLISLNPSNGLATIQDESSDYNQSWELEILGTDEKIYYKLKLPGQSLYNPFTYYVQPVRGISLIPSSSEKIRIVSKVDGKCINDNSNISSGLVSKSISLENYTDKDTKKCLFQLEKVPQANTYFIKSLIGNGLYLYSSNLNVLSGFLDQDKSRQSKNEWYIAPIDFDFYHLIHKESRKCLSNSDAQLRDCDLSDPKLVFDFLSVDSNAPAGKNESLEC